MIIALHGSIEHWVSRPYSMRNSGLPTQTSWCNQSSSSSCLTVLIDCSHQCTVQVHMQVRLQLLWSLCYIELLINRSLALVSSYYFIISRLLILSSPDVFSCLLVSSRLFPSPLISSHLLSSSLVSWSHLVSSSYFVSSCLHISTMWLDTDAAWSNNKIHWF